LPWWRRRSRCWRSGPARPPAKISEHISGIQSATEESVAALKGIGATIVRLSEIASAIASSVETQDVTALQISNNVKQAVHGTRAGHFGDFRPSTRKPPTPDPHPKAVLASARALSVESNKLRLEADKFPGHGPRGVATALLTTRS